MPRVYLSPSVQEFNPYLSGGNEEYYMNLIADAIEPYLKASGIEFIRNNPNETLSQAIKNSNEYNTDLHLAIHSNAAPEQLAGKLQGTDSYYGKEMAKKLMDNFKDIYPNADKVKIVPTTILAELRRTAAPAVLIETAYHDNPEDEKWIKENIDLIGRTIAQSITEYFGVPFVTPIDSGYTVEDEILMQ